QMRSYLTLLAGLFVCLGDEAQGQVAGNVPVYYDVLVYNWTAYPVNIENIYGQLPYGGGLMQAVNVNDSNFVLPAYGTHEFKGVSYFNQQQAIVAVGFCGCIYLSQSDYVVHNDGFGVCSYVGGVAC